MNNKILINYALNTINNEVIWIYNYVGGLENLTLPVIGVAPLLF